MRRDFAAKFIIEKVYVSIRLQVEKTQLGRNGAGESVTVKQESVRKLDQIAKLGRN